jgi:hypothetical protein
LSKKSPNKNNKRRPQSQKSISIKIINNFHELPEVNIKKFTFWKLKDKKTMRGVFSFKEPQDLTIEFTSITLASNVDASISE